MNILYKYLNESNKTPDFLDKVTIEFKKEMISYVKKEIINENIQDGKTIEKLSKLMDKSIKCEYNTMYVPYFQILENINFCVEIEMSDNLIKIEDSKKFGEKKFSEILEEGLYQQVPVKRFAISEKMFLDKFILFVEKYTTEYDLLDDSIKIEFN